MILKETIVLSTANPYDCNLTYHRYSIPLVLNAVRRRQTYTIGPHTYVYRQDIVWRRDIVMVDKNARNRLWCALRTTQGHSRTFTHETVDLHLIHGFVKEEVLLHDTAFTYNCTCIACDRIGANQPYFSSHSSLFLVKLHTRPKGVFVLCCAYSRMPHKLTFKTEF